MTIDTILRSLAVAIAALGVIDPAWTMRSRPPVPVEVRSSPAFAAEEADVRRELARRLGRTIALDSAAEPAAVVLVGDARAISSFGRDGLPISGVTTTAGTPNVRIVAADDPDPLHIGWAGTFNAVIEAVGVAGQTSAIVLEERGVELARTTHAWSREHETYEASLRYTPPAEGNSAVTVRVIPLENETTPSDNAVDLRLVVGSRPLRILVHEPRPSWNATFVRRALEGDTTFDVSTFVQASKGLTVTAGGPPAMLTADALDRFDAVVVGAPEELRAAEVEALRLFAHRRGGAVVLLPDRRPSGKYLDLIPSPQFDEVLIENAAELRSRGNGTLQASEMAVYRTKATEAPVSVLAALDQGKGARSVALEWLSGEGRVLFSGALDAWRFRAANDGGFSRFWRTRIAEAALAAPPRLDVSVSPGVPAPGDELTIRARLRRTEVESSGSRTHVPALRARLIDADGQSEVVRMWPTAERGVFSGRVTVTKAGAFDLAVSTDTGISVDEAVTVAAQARHPVARTRDVEDAFRLIAASSGGVVVGRGDLQPLEQHLRGLSVGDLEYTIRPWRSLWPMMAFVAMLSAEWAMRRRQGKP